MANVFNRRGSFFGRPDIGAASDLAAGVGQIARRNVTRAIADENQHLLDKFKIAYLAERDSLRNEYMVENADRPSEWVGELRSKKQEISKKLLDPITQPGAKREATSLFDTGFAQWKSSVEGASKTQIRRNQISDLKLGIESLQESRDDEFLTDTIVFMDTAEDYVRGQKYLTPNEKTDTIRDLARQHYGKFLVDDALRMGEDTFLKDPNKALKDRGIEVEGLLKDQPLFDSEDVAELQEAYTSSREAAEANITNTNKAMVSEATNEYQNAITGGDTSSDLRETIHQDPRFASDEVEATRLIDLLDKKNKEAIEKGKEVYSFAEIMDATESVELAIQQRDPNVKTIIAENADKLDEDLKASRKKALAYQEESLKVADTPEVEGVRDAIAASSTLKASSLTLIGARFPAKDLKKGAKQKTIDARKREIAKVNSDHIYRSREARKIGQLLDEGKITHSQAQAQWDAIKVPAKEAAAQAVTGSIAANFTTMRFGRFGPSSIPKKKAPERIRVRKPDGTVGTISKKNLVEAQKAGFEVIE